MSMDITSERVCYVHCNFCNTILAVSVPCSSSMLAIVTVRCGHCSNLLSVNVGALLHHLPLQHHLQQKMQKQDESNKREEDGGGSSSKDQEYTCGSSSSARSCNKFTASFDFSADHLHNDQPPPRITPIRPPEKRQRVPSAYNRFIKEEIQRIKASNPEISHREAFSTAAKNWAHFPHIHFGLKLDQANKQPKLDHPVPPTPPPVPVSVREHAAGPQKSRPSFYEI